MGVAEVPRKYISTGSGGECCHCCGVLRGGGLFVGHDGMGCCGP